LHRKELSEFHDDWITTESPTETRDDALSVPKCLPITPNTDEPLAGIFACWENKTIGALNVTMPDTDPMSLYADIVVVQDAPVPDTVLQATRVSLLHVVEIQELVPILVNWVYARMPICKPFNSKTELPVTGIFVTDKPETMGLANENEFVNVENCWLEFTTIQRSSKKFAVREHEAEDSDTHREEPQSNVPILKSGVLSLVPNLLP
jgi:hypothetical protein